MVDRTEKSASDRRRERIAWLVCCTGLVTLAVSLTAATASRDDDYSFVRTMVDVQRLISGNYVEPVDTQKLRDGAISGMLEQLDPFSNFVPAQRQDDFDRMIEGTFKGVGVQLNQLPGGAIEVVTPVDGSPAFKAGIMAGDVILKVNGESVEGLRLPDATRKIAGPLGSEVAFTVRRVTGEELTLKMIRQEIIIPTVRGFDRAGDNSWNYYVNSERKIAYVRVTQFTSETFDSLHAVMKQLISDGMAGLILDLRFNPGGRLEQAIEVVDLFVNDGVIVSTRGRSRPEVVARARAEGTLPKFPMIVLVNEHSASASEIVAGSLMDNRRAVVVGNRSYGKGSVQEVVPLEQGGGELKLTVAYYYLPSGRLVHRKKDATDWGVNPNIEVPLTQEQELEFQRDRYEAELFRRPTTRSAATAPSQPAAAEVAGGGGKKPLDAQLERAVDTMTAILVMGDVPAVAKPAVPTTGPSTQPVDR